MTIIALIEANLNETPIGTRSRLAEDLAGVPVLRRTVERVQTIRELEEIIVLCPESQADRARAVLRGTRAAVRPCEESTPPWRALVRDARKWSLDGWRGGIGGTTYFDEFVDARLIARVLSTKPADLVFCVPGSAVLLDPALAQRMIEHHMARRDDIRMTFTQAPPGLAGIVLDATVIAELAAKDVPIGWVFNYKPDHPQKDLIFQPCCIDLPPEVRYAVGRMCADTDRAITRIEQLLREGADADAATIGRWLIHHEESTVDFRPREIEIELTTDDPFPDALLRPRGSRVGSRGPIDLPLIGRIANEMAEVDDGLLVLGGFGDPLRHPQFRQVLEAIRSVTAANGRGVYGLAVRTAGVDLNDEHIDALITHGVNLVEFSLDAWTPELYACLQSPADVPRADLDAVISRIDRLSTACRERRSIRPIVVPCMTKSRENVHELDDFHDGWLRKTGSVCVAGYSHRASQLADRMVINMSPTPRVPCRRLRSRCVVLADGRATPCDEDFRGVLAVGDLRTRSLMEIWQSSEYRDFRTAHQRMSLESLPLCSRCDEWHRP